MNYNTYLEYIEENINDLVKVQDQVVKEYKNLDKDNLDKIANIRQGLQDEQDILSGLMNNLNKLFGIRPSWHRRGFIIIPIELGKYKIKHPRIDKSSTEYLLLKKLLLDLHKKYFLCDGMLQYIVRNEDKHMWEIPNKIPDDEFIRKLRRQINVN